EEMESKKGGYRNTIYGSQKAYRVMMTSVSPAQTSQKLHEYIKAYQVQKADTVNPGTQILDGRYANLVVPAQHLSDFLARVSSVEEATILENKTRSVGAPGMNKVFIWIKSI